MSRIGKIARLPRELREELNHRLDDGKSASSILSWLNKHDDVKDVLGVYFHDQPITASNLSDWRQGGYQDWLRNQEGRAFARDILAEAEELEDEVAGSRLTDRVTEIAALSLIRLLRKAQAEEGPCGRAAVIEIIRELQRLRRGDHAMARVQMKEQRWEAERQAAEVASLKQAQQETATQKSTLRILGEALWQEYRDGMAKGTLAPERAATIRNLFNRCPRVRRRCSIPDLPPENAGPPAPKASPASC